MILVCYLIFFFIKQKNSLLVVIASIQHTRVLLLYHSTIIGAIRGEEIGCASPQIVRVYVLKIFVSKTHYTRRFQYISEESITNSFLK